MRRWPAIVLACAIAAGVGELVVYRDQQAGRAGAEATGSVPGPAPTSVAPSTTTTTTAPVELAPGAPAEPIGSGEVASTVPPCGADQVAFVVTTPSSAVLPGVPVEITARQSNIGDHPCQWPGDIRFSWRDSEGGQFELARADVQPITVQWQPGQVLEQRATWDQRFANGTTAALGFAAVVVTWGPAGGPANSASASFLIGLPPPPPTPA